MPHRVAGYVGLGIRTFGIPIYSHVIYFHPDAGLNDPGEYVQDGPGYEITIKYKVIRLSEIEGQDHSGGKAERTHPIRTINEAARGDGF